MTLVWLGAHGAIDAEDRDMMDDCERAELMAQDRADKRWLSKYSRHPDCSDPSHPGCDACRDLCLICDLSADDCQCDDTVAT